MTAIYRAFLDYAVPTVITLAGAQAAIEGIAALQRQQQVVVIALHRRFMSLGGSFQPQVATPCAIQSGDVTPVCGNV